MDNKQKENELADWMDQQIENYESKTGEVWNNPVCREQWEEMMNHPKYSKHINRRKKELEKYKIIKNMYDKIHKKTPPGYQ